MLPDAVVTYVPDRSRLLALESRVVWRVNSHRITLR